MKSLLNTLLVFILILSVYSCATKPNTNANNGQVLSQEIFEAIAVCSMGYSKSDSASFNAELLTARLDVRGALSKTAKGEISSGGQVRGENWLSMYKGYLACIDKRLLNKEANGRASPKTKGIQMAPPKNNVIPKRRTIKLNGVEFTLNKCIRENMDVSCHFTLRSDGQNKLVKFTQESKLYDDHANEYRLQSARIANTEQENMLNYRVEKLLIANISTQAVINFKNFSTNANKMSYLQFAMYVEQIYKKLQFRDISIASNPEI